MSLLILDDQLDRKLVQRPLQRWITCQVLHDLRPDELILDDRVPEILLTLAKPISSQSTKDFGTVNGVIPVTVFFTLPCGMTNRESYPECSDLYCT